MLLKKYKGFTLAELMVIMAVLTVLLAAVAPVFTARYKHAAIDQVWQPVSDDEFNDIYSDAPNKSMIQTTYIGATPADGTSAKIDYAPYSKIVIRSGDNVNSSGQKQIEFRYDDDKDNRVYLFSGYGNFLLGGLYNNYSNAITASNNTAYGSLALTSLTAGNNNTAIGYYAGYTASSGSFNTLLGYQAGFADSSGYNLGIGSYNVVAGNNIRSGSAASGDLLIGDNIITGSGLRSSANSVIGSNISFDGIGNTILGYHTISSELESAKVMNNNTIIGASSINDRSITYDTLIGYNSCSNITENSHYKTCVGSVDGSKIPQDNNETVYIGGPVSNYNSASVMEIHNPGSSGKNPTVVINGDLVVRGQPYLKGISRFPYSVANQNTKAEALMGYYLLDLGFDNAGNDGFYALAGDDGMSPTVRLFSPSYYRYQKMTGHEHCICAYDLNSNEGIKSYDWTSRYNYPVYDGDSIFVGGARNIFDLPTFSINSYNSYYIGVNPSSIPVIELNNAHGIMNSNNASCCPLLTENNRRTTYSNPRLYTSSDRRLKYIGDTFNDGLNKLSKLNVYNYTYKSDKSKSPFVGVIAQDLKKVFPNSVFKNNKGYYEIRRDEIFYAAINSVKTLNKKIINFSKRIENNISRVNKLRKDNQKLIESLDKLELELSNLEANK